MRYINLLIKFNDADAWLIRFYEMGALKWRCHRDTKHLPIKMYR